MAEVLIAGPLLNLKLFLAKWVWRRYKQKNTDKEHDREFTLLLTAVEKLSSFAHEKSQVIKALNQQFGVRSDAFGT